MSAEQSAHTTAKHQGHSMRGILSYGRQIINEVQEFGFRLAMVNLRDDAAKAIDAVFAFYWHQKGFQHGMALYARIPCTHFSTFLYWHEENLGWGLERSSDGYSIYLWRFQINLCHEQGIMFGSDL